MSHLSQSVGGARWSGSDAGDVLGALGRSLVPVPVRGDAPVPAAGGGVGRGPPRVGLSGELAAPRRRLLRFIQPEERQHEEDAGRGDDHAAGDEDVEKLSGAVHQDS